MGFLVDQFNKRGKIMDFREAIGNRIFYRGKHTRKFKRFMTLCSRAGMYQETINAIKFLQMMNEKQLQ